MEKWRWCWRDRNLRARSNREEEMAPREWHSLSASFTASLSDLLTWESLWKRSPRDWWHTCQELLALSARLSKHNNCTRYISVDIRRGHISYRSTEPTTCDWVVGTFHTWHETLRILSVSSNHLEFQLVIRAREIQLQYCVVPSSICTCKGHNSLDWGASYAILWKIRSIYYTCADFQVGRENISNDVTFGIRHSPADNKMCS